MSDRKNELQTPLKQSAKSSRHSQIPFYLIASIYMAWLLWLAYVAWVNIQSGNQ